MTTDMIGDRQDNRAEGFANTVRHHLGVVDRRKNRGDERYARGCRSSQVNAARKRREKDQPRQCGPCPGPPRHSHCLHGRCNPAPSRLYGNTADTGVATCTPIAESSKPSGAMFDRRLIDLSVRRIKLLLHPLSAFAERSSLVAPY
jgi:hypothetical protein